MQGCYGLGLYDLFQFYSYQGSLIFGCESGTDMLLSKEGVTQGDPLSMLLYSVATFPLIDSL